MSGGADQPAGRIEPRLAGQRILVGPNDIAGFASRIARALAQAGADVRFFNGQDHPFNPHLAESPRLRRLFGRTIGIASRWRAHGGLRALAGKLLATGAKLAAFAFACGWARTWVMLGGKGFFAGGVEYAFLRLLGKRVVHIFVGTASRPRYLSGSAKSVLKDGRIDLSALRQLARRTRRQAARIRSISRHASVVIENPLCGHFQERPFVNYFKIGVPLDADALLARAGEGARPADPSAPPDRIRILHGPSRPEIKGSVRIQQVVEQLIRQGWNIDFRQVTGVPHAQMLREMAQCDLAIDQLYSDSPLAGFAAEVSALGRPVVVGGYGWPIFRNFLDPAETPPTAACHPDQLAATLETLLRDPALRRETGESARRFLQEVWSEPAFAARFARIVAGDIPEDWWIRPEQVEYLHGMGLPEPETRAILAAFLQHHGPSALGLEHLPSLAQRFQQFALASR